MRPIKLAVVAVCIAALPARADDAPKDAPKIAVGVVTAERKPVSGALDFVGRVEAIDRVEIRARVTGYLEAVEFKEGELITSGSPLYRIEDGLFKAAVSEAEGALDRSNAAKILTAVQLDRAKDLLARDVGTVVARDQALAADEQAKGTILVDQANLDTAKINLGYTQILAPVTGKIGRTNVTKGNVVKPETGPLTVIVSQDPMYVTFPVSQREFLRIQQNGKSLDLSQLKATLRFADGRTYDHQGAINFVDVTVNRSTDTVLVRATFPNPDSALLDGQFVRVAVESSTPTEKVVIPQAALIADQQGVYVFVVEDGKAAIRRVKPGGQLGSSTVIEDGLSGGEQVIVEGLQGVKPGAPVIASPLPQALNRS
ncbi:efflux RND transporter periplasmic adaptor subunit [Hyphomicrobium sp.]|jgi:membrane fusion protein (multidrug efflux system)|uniref:efflux RND transporter periplasmic adaptor subunit n=1 Tax=Hyphomicrobium sp. TaxID=82 RepID=UPI0035669C69